MFLLKLALALQIQRLHVGQFLQERARLSPALGVGRLRRAHVILMIPIRSVEKRGKLDLELLEHIGLGPDRRQAVAQLLSILQRHPVKDRRLEPQANSLGTRAQLGQTRRHPIARLRPWGRDRRPKIARGLRGSRRSGTRLPGRDRSWRRCFTAHHRTPLRLNARRFLQFRNRLLLRLRRLLNFRWLLPEQPRHGSDQRDQRHDEHDFEEEREPAVTRLRLRWRSPGLHRIFSE